MSTQASIRTAGALSLALIAATACDRQAVTDTPAAPAAAPAAASGQQATYNDALITTSVQAGYFADATVRGHRIDVDTKDGIVTLSGAVNSEAERSQAVAIARQVDGVKRVEDQLRLKIGPSSTQAKQDAPPAAKTADRTRTGAGWLGTKIQAQYFMDPDVKSWNIDVDTTSTGVVTLRGEVESDQVKQEAVRIAKSTEGVTSVVDRLTVRGAATGQGAENRGEPLGDPWITAIIQSKYFIDEDVKGAQIDVTTQDGVVALTGQVDSAAEKRQAVALARSTNGVRDVKDQLTVRVGATSGAASVAPADRRDLGERVEDSDITTKIQSKYFIDSQVRALNIDVTTANGVVTLKGAVDSAEARRAAETIARETDGVTRVVNNLTIEAGT